jgi:hypothetical protein
MACASYFRYCISNSSLYNTLYDLYALKFSFLEVTRLGSSDSLKNIPLVKHTFIIRNLLNSSYLVTPSDHIRYHPWRSVKDLNIIAIKRYNHPKFHCTHSLGTICQYFQNYKQPNSSFRNNLICGIV